MSQKNKILLITILAIAFSLRFYRLGSIPQGFFSDEAAVGYNTYSLIKTGRDEFGKSWPLFFTSFGEGKLPLYVYQSLPWMALFGPNELAVRFSGAFWGSLTVLIWFFTIQEFLKLSKVKKKYHLAIGLASAFVLAIMPWHIHFSRGVFGQESIFWIILGSFLILKGARSKKKMVLFLGLLSFAASLLIYHAPKVVLPLWTPTILYLGFKKSKEKIITFSKKVIPGLLVLVAVWALMSFHPAGLTRSKGISVFSTHSGVSAKIHESLLEENRLSRPAWFSRLFHNKVESYGREIAGRYLSHFNPDFLFVSGDLKRARYRVPGVAQVYLVFLPFALVGFYYLLNKKVWLILILASLAPLPAALTFETPSTVRALLLTVPLSTIIGTGLVISFSYIKSFSKRVFWPAVALSAVSLFYQFIYFLNSYFYLAQIHKPYAWQYAYNPLVKRVSVLEENYDRVVVTGMGGPPYIFFLFYKLYDPVKFQEEVHSQIGETDPFGFIHITGFGKYRFPKEPYPFDEKAKKTLFVCQGKVKKEHEKYLIEIVYFADKTPAFTILDPEHEI